MADRIDTPKFTYEEALGKAVESMKHFRQLGVFSEAAHCHYFLFGYTTALLEENLDAAKAIINQKDSDFLATHLFSMGYRLGCDHLKKVNHQNKIPPLIKGGGTDLLNTSPLL